MKSFVIGKNDAGQRVNKFIEKAVPDLPRSLMHKYLRLKRIKLNRKRCNPEDKLVEGDVLELWINDEFFSDNSSQEMQFLKAPAELNIVYEDENILLVDKHAGLVVHEDESGVSDTLINRILHYLYEKGEYQPQLENSFVPALCNRIDRNTSGIVIAAKNAESLRILNQKVKDRELQKLYLCIIHGEISPKADTLRDYLLKNEKDNLVKVFKKQVPDSKTIITKYKTLRSNGRYSLLEVDLKTGRTHQIRAHFAFYGHPLVGDTKYGRNRDNKDNNFKYQALYSYKLIFDFKTDGGILNYLNGKTFQCDSEQFKKWYDFCGK